MPKRVINHLNRKDAKTLNNELVITDSGLGLYYNNTVYEFNGNEKLMAFVNSKGTTGNLNKTGIQTLHIDSGNVPSITNENRGYIL